MPLNRPTTTLLLGDEKMFWHLLLVSGLSTLMSMGVAVLAPAGGSTSQTEIIASSKTCNRYNDPRRCKANSSKLLEVAVSVTLA